MVLSYSPQKNRKIFETDKLLRKAYGQQATKIMQRIKEFEAAENLEDIFQLPGPRCHELKGTREGVFSVDLIHPYRLLFKPAAPVPTKADGGIDVASVREIVILSVEDTH